ncbi:MAG: hypothetical protein H3C52_05925 [Anaerolineales bacterium]|nr:hypothetical protein [Anaerolineales bacterium]MCZ2289378.1 hypothetical protein [Anaerolineales bacterium]
MENQMVLFVVLTGLLFRLGIPIAITITAILLLRKVDARWQAEAKAESIAEPVLVEKENCWEYKECGPEIARGCPAANSLLPCWQAMRQENGYLREECLNCKIFQQAPAPVPSRS